jgi:hypothetical protein
VLGSAMPDFKNVFGTKEQVDPVRHLIGTAAVGADSREGRNLSQEEQ